ncbi:GNAT family N-acetyltransferase [Nitrincola tapanii]|uniref:GNAT family N-acetyltransferase n=1 Tax=Nitrincola tapanii TaxID=1708751 RepID=A0A5A9W0Q4_9GAMM|nr:GNAT family N-acetyltransferase [Nitrincola tapanii]KAA0874133.1 GNAT family N-acetyltransferase [Nitrincola tapanii]
MDTPLFPTTDTKLSVTCLVVDYQDAQQGAELLHLMNTYAQDPMGGGEALRPEVQARLLQAMAERPHLHSFIAYVQGQAVGLINCVEGFSTFAAQPLLNIHDVIVLPTLRGQGIARHLFQCAEEKAKALGCCKLTLEVLQGNEKAKQVYRSLGYQPYQLDEATGQAEFWEKKI